MTVRRSRFLSTTVEPLRLDVDIPPPNTSERPPPLPECNSTRAINPMERMMWKMMAKAVTTFMVMGFEQ